MDLAARFEEFGWARLEHAFSAEAAANMREATWGCLASEGVDPRDRSTWTVERPTKLQALSKQAAFRAVGGEAVRAAIHELMGGQAYGLPDAWGAVFLAFPTQEPWVVPARGWHADANYLSALDRPGGVKTLALFGDVAQRAGGTLILSGSHRLVHRWFQRHPPPARARSADMRELLLGHPYIRDLHTDGEPEARIDRFVETAEYHDGIPLQVVEAAGAAGDVFLLHPLTLHVAAPNTGSEPRFLLSGGVTNNQWGWAAT